MVHDAAASLQHDPLRSAVHSPLTSRGGNDLDGDGLDDTWEMLTGMADPNADLDHDGHTTRQEYRAMTDPRDPASVLKFEVTRRANGQTQIRWRAVPGLRYHVHRRVGLGGGAWQEIGVVVPANSIGSFFDIFVGDEAFYQVSIE